MKSRIGVAAAIGCVLVVALVGCGDSGSSQDALKEAEHQGAERAQQHAKQRQFERELRELKRERKHDDHGSGQPAPESTGSAPEGSSGNCGGGLSANEYTTCGFAENVEDAYYSEIGSGSGTVYAWSPTTEQNYSMYCTSGEPHECTGGNNAAVFFP